MNFFNKLPGYTNAPSGMEWVILKKLPGVFVISTLIPSAEMLYLYLVHSPISAEQQITIYLCLGLIFTFWFFIGVIAVGCIVVIIMKGPAYVADPYELPKENKNLEKYPHL